MNTKSSKKSAKATKSPASKASKATTSAPAPRKPAPATTPAAPQPVAQPAPASAARLAPAVAAVTPVAKPPREKKKGTYEDMAKNRIKKSAVEGPVFEMWSLCNTMIGKTRKEVIAAAVEAGINYYTARTQYQLWLVAARNSAASIAANAKK